MDTSDLTERYFDENSVLYNITNRNDIVFGEVTQEPKKEAKEETITFTPGEGVTATVHGQDAEAPAAEEGSVNDLGGDSDEQTLIAFWRMYKESNPEGTLDDFYKDVLNTNSDVQ
jgi:hypothetical protein